MNRRNGSRDFGSNADDNYFRYGGNNEYIKTESDQKEVMLLSQHNRLR